MNLVSKSSFLFHSKNVMRLGVVLVITSMIVSWAAVPKAKAVAVVDDVALGAAATAAYLTSTGIPLTVTAGGASAASAGIVAVAGEYAAATGAAASGEALLTTIAAGTALTTAGAVVLTAAAAAAVGALAYWVYQTYFADGDTSATVYDKSGYFDVNGLCVSDDIPFGTRVDFGNGHYVEVNWVDEAAEKLKIEFNTSKGLYHSEESGYSEGTLVYDFKGSFKMVGTGSNTELRPPKILCNRRSSTV